MFTNLFLPVLLAAFAVAAGVIWWAGIKLSDTTDVLAHRLGLGDALGGIILLAIATNLPELAITASAAWRGDLGVAIGNILGGIGIQTVVLVALDAFGTRGRWPLTYQAASLSLVLEGGLVVAVLVVAVMGTRLPSELIVFRLAPGGVLIALLWVGGVWLIQPRQQGPAMVRGRCRAGRAGGAERAQPGEEVGRCRQKVGQHHPYSGRVRPLGPCHPRLRCGA